VWSMSEHQTVMKKVDVDRNVAAQLGLKTREVSTVTDAFLQALKLGLLSLEPVKLDGFGTFRIYDSASKVTKQVVRLKKTNGEYVQLQVNHAFRVSFAKAFPFKKLIQERLGKGTQEKPLEKYAVDEGGDQEKLEKQAAKDCPKCGSNVEKHGRTLVCPRCGSEPFEK
jgi:nucleoid DNA-binding protein/ribosomal protein S27AE